MRFALLVVAALVTTAVLAALILITPVCKPGDKGVRIGSVVLVAGC